MRQVTELQMFGARGCEAGRRARESFEFSGFGAFQVHGIGAERYLSVSAGAERSSDFAGSWVDGYRHSLRYGNNADSGVYDIGGAGAGEVKMSCKILTILLILQILVQTVFAQAVWDGTADTTWYTDNKSETEFTITTAEQLAGLALLVNGSTNNDTYDMSGKTIMLGANIMFNDTTDWQDWVNNPPANTWVGIGLYSESLIYNRRPFNGIFDGNGYVVSGVYTYGLYQGLFGYIGQDGMVKKLGIVASCIGAYSYIGGLAGMNYGAISDSYFSGIVFVRPNTAVNYVGGLVGYNYKDGSSTSGTINNSYSLGMVTGSDIDNRIGGLVGNNNGGAIENSYSNSTVSGKDYVGGLVGYNLAKFNTISINNSYSTGTVTGKTYVGGLIGRHGEYVSNSATENSVKNSYSTATVTGESYVGGFVGEINLGGTSSPNAINNSYSIGTVTGSGNNVGGFVGYQRLSYVRNIYYDGQTSGQSDGIGGGNTDYNTGNFINKTTAEMKLQPTFLNWDFNEIWSINSIINNGYPYLLWSEEILCLEAGHVYDNGICKTAEQYAREVCEATEGSQYIDGVCKTAEQLAKEACEATEGMIWENNKCVTPIRLPQTTSNQIKVRIASNFIVLENLPSNTKIEVYNLHGKRIYNSQFSTLNSQLIKVQTKGIYLVKAGTQIFRVAVR